MIRCLIPLKHSSKQLFSRESAAVFGGLHAAAGVCDNLRLLVLLTVTPAFPILRAPPSYKLRAKKGHAADNPRLAHPQIDETGLVC